MAGEDNQQLDAAALAGFLGIGSGATLSGTGQISAIENLAGFGSNMLGQALLGFLDGSDIATVVEGLSYEPYEGPSPLALQQEINESIRRIGQRLGIAPETLNTISTSVINGTPVDVALDAISGVVFRDETGAPLMDVPAASTADFNALKNSYSEFAKAVDAEKNVFQIDGDLYRYRPEADVRKDMEELGFVGQFNDPDLWKFQPDAALASAAADIQGRADKQGELADDLRDKLGRVGFEMVQGAVNQRDTGEMNQGIVDFFNRSVTPPSVEAGLSAVGARMPEGGSVGAPTPERLALLNALVPGATTSRGVEAVGGAPPAGVSSDPMNQLYQLTGGRNVMTGYGGADIVPKSTGTPQDLLRRMTEQGLETGSPTSWIDLAGAATPGEPLSTGAENAPALRLPPAQQQIMDRQREAALKAADRYATFAAAEEARKGVPAAEEALRQQIKDAGIEQSSLSQLARQRAQDAVERGSVAGDQALSDFRQFIAGSLPYQTKPQSGGGGRPRVRLSDEVIKSAARAAAAPVLRAR